ncbi:hypothetical protein DL765_007312 [Monosporascus sp. GIB2]|nr:hypothetical protein DL765_007312 [Monosporascus sp. GIB2]
MFGRCMNKQQLLERISSPGGAQAMTKDDENAETPPSPPLHKILFVNRSATLVPCRAILHTQIVQCIFAHNYITLTFLKEQKNKSELTKRIEQTSGDLDV